MKLSLCKLLITLSEIASLHGKEHSNGTEHALESFMRSGKLGLFGSLAVLIAAVVLTEGSKAATIIAATPALQDVSAAVTQAKDGDTVVVPSGAATWTSALNINKAITLIGGGVGA